MLALADVPSRFPPERPALVQDGVRWTFGELDHRSQLWAQTLVARGVKQDDLVAYALPNGPDFMALTFGIYRAGATPAPLSPKLPAFERDAIVATMRPRLFLSADDALNPGSSVFTPRPPAASWKACTSGGSTGQPKVIIDGRPAAFAPEIDFIAIPADAPVLVAGPLYHNAPFSAAVLALLRGCTVVTMPRFDAAQALMLIERERIDWALMVPTMLHRVHGLPAGVRAVRDLSSWRTVVHTAAPMPAWLKHWWIAEFGPDHIWEVYGATEGIVRCWIGGREWLDRPGSVGRPLGGARLKILDPDGSEAPAGLVGEVFAMPASGPASTYRYLGAERRSAIGGWESVGDCGHVDAEGYLYLADRRNDLIISGGVNIWPAEVEAALLRHPAVRSCAVFGEADPDLGERVHALIESATPLDREELRAFLADYLSPPKLPREITCQTGPVRDDAGKFRKPRKAA